MSGLLYVSEIFGPTLQGEGPNTGRPCMFIRLGGCNLTCRDCDTPYTWDASRYDLRDELHPWHPDRVYTAVAGDDMPRLVVISGGEPLLHMRRGLGALVARLITAGRHVQFETNGTIAPPVGLSVTSGITFVASPKVAGAMSDDPAHRRIRPLALSRLATLARRGTACFKFVAATPDDLAEVDDLVATYQIPTTEVWIMPEGRTADVVADRARTLVDHVIRRGYNLSGRQHLAWWPGEERGR